MALKICEKNPQKQGAPSFFENLRLSSTLKPESQVKPVIGRFWGRLLFYAVLFPQVIMRMGVLDTRSIFS
jgi:hypothetical protein